MSLIDITIIILCVNSTLKIILLINQKKTRNCPILKKKENPNKILTLKIMISAKVLRAIHREKLTIRRNALIRKLKLFMSLKKMQKGLLKRIQLIKNIGMTVKSLWEKAKKYELHFLNTFKCINNFVFFAKTLTTGIFG